MDTSRYFSPQEYKYLPLKGALIQEGVTLLFVEVIGLKGRLME
jgi:hypothetical protein